MAARPDEAPDFNFDFEPEHFDPDVVQHELLWPLVDQIWPNGNWLEGALLHDEMAMPAHGTVAGVEWQTVLEACCEEDENAVESDSRINTLSLVTERVATGVEESFIMNSIKAGVANLADEMPLTAKGLFSEYEESDLKVKQSIGYYFIDNGEYLIVQSQVVEANAETVTFNPGYSDADDPQDKEVHKATQMISAEDLDRIGIAMRLLGASAVLLGRIEDIKSSPL